MKLVVLATIFTLGACAPTASPSVALPPSSASALGQAPDRSTSERTYAGEPLTCAAAGEPCIYILADESRHVETATLSDAPYQEIWLHRPGARDRRIAESRPSETSENRLAAIVDPKFSPDGKHLYVGADGAAVSPSIREIDLDGGGSRYVIDGELFGFRRASDGPPRYLLQVYRYLLDLDHAVDDPDYAGRCEYVFELDPETKKAVRITS